MHLRELLGSWYSKFLRKLRRIIQSSLKLREIRRLKLNRVDSLK